MSGPTCPLCTSTEVERVLPHRDFSATTILRCPRCDFWFGTPVPSEKELEAYYKTTYKQRRSWSGAPEYFALMERRAVAQVRFIGSEIPKVGSAIDVGCGVGALVAELQRAGLDAVGVDSDESVIESGRKRYRINVDAKHLTDSDESKRYDLLCLSHVVEHFRSPVDDLRSLVKRLNPGGWVMIEVPHSASRIFNEDFDPESHLGFHTPRSLGILAQTAGLQIHCLRNCGPLLQIPSAVGSTGTVPSWPVRVMNSLRRRSGRMLARLFPNVWQLPTAYDGYFERYYAEGDERGMWLRALLRRPID